jgi:hypothetical protein
LALLAGHNNNFFRDLALRASTQSSGANTHRIVCRYFRAQRFNNVDSANGASVLRVCGSSPSRIRREHSVGLRQGNYNSGEISFLAVFPTELTGADLALVEQIAAATNGAVLA